MTPIERAALEFRTDVGDGAVMSSPAHCLEWYLRYGEPDKVRFVAASVVASYAYLLDEISMSEAMRRLRLIRKTRAAFAAAAQE